MADCTQWNHRHYHPILDINELKEKEEEERRRLGNLGDEILKGKNEEKGRRKRKGGMVKEVKKMKEMRRR